MTRTESYTKELQLLHHHRVNLILLVGTTLLLVFSVLDLVIAPHYFRDFLLYREILAMLALGLLVLNHQDKHNRFPLYIGLAFYLATSLCILLAIRKTGGLNSTYHVGLILAMTVYIALAPLSLRQTLQLCFGIILLYGITIFTLHPLHQLYLQDFLTNIFFMVSFSFIIGTQSWVNTRLRQREYKLRTMAQIAAWELQNQARKLELEVEKRSKEQRETEERHRLLFEQIADDAVVISPSGEILQSNKSFASHYLSGLTTTNVSIYDVVVKRVRADFSQRLQTIIETGRPLTGYQTFLIKTDLTVTEVEINANLVQETRESAAILLVIRDISTRKRLEKRLINSLKQKQKTETAAIMALAKLSEFRDATQGNHLERIREYCRLLATEMAKRSDLKQVVTKSYIEDIFHASILHDIGKVAVPDQLLFARKNLTDEEQELVRRHAVIGGDVIREMEKEAEGSSFLTMARHIAYSHHEHYDGTGYPYGLSGKEIPLAARIMAVADYYEEMTAGINPPSSMSHREAANEILKKSGNMFDPMVVEAFVVEQAGFNTIRELYS